MIAAAALAMVGADIVVLNHTCNGREHGTGGSVAHPLRLREDPTQIPGDCQFDDL
jgi:hypothetical protein